MELSDDELTAAISKAWDRLQSAREVWIKARRDIEVAAEDYDALSLESLRRKARGVTRGNKSRRTEPAG